MNRLGSILLVVLFFVNVSAFAADAVAPDVPDHTCTSLKKQIRDAYANDDQAVKLLVDGQFEGEAKGAASNAAFCDLLAKKFNGTTEAGICPGGEGCVDNPIPAPKSIPRNYGDKLVEKVEPKAVGSLFDAGTVKTFLAAFLGGAVGGWTGVKLAGGGNDDNDDDYGYDRYGFDRYGRRAPSVIDPRYGRNAPALIDPRYVNPAYFDNISGSSTWNGDSGFPRDYQYMQPTRDFLNAPPVIPWKKY